MTKTAALTLVLAMPYFDGMVWQRSVGEPFDTSKLDDKVVEKLKTKGFLMSAAAYKARTNPEAAQAQASADAAAADLARITALFEDVDSTDEVIEEVQQLQRQAASAGDLRTKVAQLEVQVTTLTQERDEARSQQAKPEDATALTLYREAVGPLLPTAELAPKAYKSLLTNGYFTVKLVQAAPDEALKALTDVGDTTVATLRRLYPVQG